MQSILEKILINIPKLKHCERSKLSLVLRSIDDLKNVCDLVETVQEATPHCPHCSGKESYSEFIKTTSHCNWTNQPITTTEPKLN